MIRREIPLPLLVIFRLFIKKAVLLPDSVCGYKILSKICFHLHIEYENRKIVPRYIVKQSIMNMVDAISNHGIYQALNASRLSRYNLFYLFTFFRHQILLDSLPPTSN